MRKLRCFLLCVSLVGLGISAASAVGPKTQVMVSDQDVDLDQLVSIEAQLTWPQVTGSYKFMPPEIEADNLEFDHDSRTEETFMDGGRPWQRATLIYYFKPSAVGTATLKHIKISYLNVQTQETGTINLVRAVDFKVHPPQRSGFWLVIMGSVVMVVLAAGGFLAMWSSKKAGEKLHREHVIQEQNELEAVLGKIQNASGTSQKEVVFDWAKQLKTFVVHHYHLPKTLMTESDTVEAIKQLNLPQSEKMRVEQLFERLDQAKFTARDLSDEILHQLQNDLVQFIKSKQIIGAP